MGRWVVALATALAIGGCSDPAAPASPQPGSDAQPADPAAASPDPPCAPRERPRLQPSQHLVGDGDPPGPYESVPPTSGWHDLRVPDAGRADEPLRDPTIVSAIENGIVVLAVAPDTLDALDDQVVDDLVAQFPDRVLVTPYATPMPRPVALVSWGVLQRCDTVDLAATTAFVLEERSIVDGAD